MDFNEAIRFLDGKKDKVLHKNCVLKQENEHKVSVYAYETPILSVYPNGFDVSFGNKKSKMILTYINRFLPLGFLVHYPSRWPKEVKDFFKNESQTDEEFKIWWNNKKNRPSYFEFVPWTLETPKGNVKFDKKLSFSYQGDLVKTEFPDKFPAKED